MLKFLKAAFEFINHLFTSREAAKEKENKNARIEANKAELERDRIRASRRALRFLQARMLREKTASGAPTVSIPAAQQ